MTGNEMALMASIAVDMQDKKIDDVLDKIRAEIIEACGYSKDYVGTFDYSTTNLKIVLQIIDKYTAESEVPT